MKTSLFILTILVAVTAVTAIPLSINYQGKIDVDGTPFSGFGQFKFAIVDESGATTYWSNDGTSSGGSEPAAAASIGVNNGLYHVILGETDGMDTIPGSVFANDTLYLRIWFDDGVNGSQVMLPDQQLTSVGFAFKAGDADTVDGLEGADLEESAEIDGDILIHAGVADAHHAKTTSFTDLTDTATDAQIPDGITIDYATAAGDADTLDGQDGLYYDDDQPDDDSEVPDNISVDNGRLYAPSGSGSVGIGTTSPNAGAALDINSAAGALLLPRMTTASRDALTPAGGMMIYNTDLNRFQGYLGGTVTSFGNTNVDTNYGNYLAENGGHHVFYPPTNTWITRIRIWVASYQTPVTTTVSIYDDKNAVCGGAPTNLGTSGSLLVVPSTWNEFIFTTPVQVTAAAKYHIWSATGLQINGSTDNPANTITDWYQASSMDCFDNTHDRPVEIFVSEQGWIDLH